MIEWFDIKAAVDAIFQLSAVLTGLLFSIYCFVIVSSNPFIERVRTTTSYQRSKTYVWHTVSMGMALTLVSLLMSVAKFPQMLESVILILLALFTCWWLVRFRGCLKRFEILS